MSTCHMSLRWGIASAGKISHDFVAAVHTLPASDHEVVAVAARSKDSAEKFAKTHNISKAYEGYINLALDKDIDVVYIGTLNPQHFEVSKLMLDHGKHVLCEKPLTLNEKHTRELLDYAKSKKLFFMEAIWTRCFPVYKELRKQLDSGAIGNVLYTRVEFGFKLDEVPRVSQKDLGGSVVLDIGIYTLQFTQFVFRGLKPVKVIGTGHLNRYGTDEIVNGILVYPEGRAGVISCSAKTEMPNEALIVGTQGIIKIPMFWCPSKLITSSKTFEFEIPKTALPLNFHNSGGLAYEAEEVRQCIKNGLLESPLVPHSDTIELSQFMDTLRKDIGVVLDS